MSVETNVEFLLTEGQITPDTKLAQNSGNFTEAHVSIAGVTNASQDASLGEQISNMKKSLDELAEKRRLARSAMDHTQSEFLSSEGSLKGIACRMLNKIGLHLLAERIYPVTTTREHYLRAKAEASQKKVEIEISRRNILQRTKPSVQTALDHSTNQKQSGQLSANLGFFVNNDEAQDKSTSGKKDLGESVPDWRDWAEAFGNRKTSQDQTRENDSEPRLPRPVYLVPGPIKEPISVSSQKDLVDALRKITDLGPCSPADVWKKLNEIVQMQNDPVEMFKRFEERVSPPSLFAGWHKAPMGKMWSVIFTIEAQQIYFRVGSHNSVYLSRHKPSDR